MDKNATDELWMNRCFDLARQGIGYVSPNPPVGAVLVHDNRIIGEGFHTSFGAPHAEVEAVANVAVSERHLIPQSILYVSLEPCCVTGKTPPCTNLIWSAGIKDVRISTLDPNPDVAGNGVRLLQDAGISVTTGILQTEGQALIRSFAINILERRPYVILKWAQSKYGIIGVEGQQVWMSDPLTRIWSHGQRAQVDAILVGSRTVMTDDPSLTVRDYPGRSPHRVIFDPNGKLDQRYKVFNSDGCQVFYFSMQPNEGINNGHIHKFVLEGESPVPGQLLNILFKNGIGILLIEGGAYMHNLFIEQDMWDEAWVIRTPHPLDKGIVAPNVREKKIEVFCCGNDVVVGIRR
jgi:diaminohydroxyphosphoribosylaminopyrimidine deaminase/5-amino-6-(5-phosphoribosylamino)uracil reductase